MGNSTTTGIELDPDLMKQAKAVPQDPSIEIKNLHLSFGAVEVLNDLNLEIGKGEFLVLLGSSGCGKSTLLNCIAGLLDVTDGQIHIGGRNVTWEEPSDRGIGMVFQSYALYPQMSVEGNLSFGLKERRRAKGGNRGARWARGKDSANRAIVETQAGCPVWRSKATGRDWTCISARRGCLPV